MKTTYLSLKTSDALHGSSSIAVNCDLFITKDKSFSRLSDLPAIIRERS